MTATVTSDRAAGPVTDWKKAVAPYRRPHLGRSIWQIVNTVGPYLGLWFLMVFTLEISYLLTLALAIPAAGFLIRSFIISHDCGHGAFFRSRRANDIVGTITALFAFTPYEQWRHEHAVHHASGGDLDHRGIGDIWTMTVEEYMRASRVQRFRYRLHRSPWVLFTVGAFIQFVILQRFPRRPMSAREKNSIWLTNALVAVVSAGMCLLIGWKAFLLIQIPVMVLASSVGVWLFYVQHQFEGVHWSRHEQWDFARGAVEGSSFYKLPPVLQWISGNIGFHHIHHLSPRIPNYYLEKCYRENPVFQEVSTITLRASMKSLTFRLWDEELQTLVGYDGVKAYRTRHGLAPGALPAAA
jgi:omega-6 fatty acid desaturase (delta-12 desaturase)